MLRKRAVSALLAIAMVLSCLIPLAACGASAELSSIEITTPPTKTEYIAGEKFDPAGMVVTAKYDDETEKTLTAEDWTYDLTGELKTSDRNVTVSYTENEVTKTVRQRITVTNDVVEAAIKTHATKTQYLPGEVFDPAGMVITVTYEDGSSEDITAEDSAVTVDETPIAEGQTSVEIKVGDVVLEEPITTTAGIFVEAEDGIIDSGSGKEFNDSADATGGGYVGDMKSGDTLSFLFSANKAGSAEIIFRLASQYLKEDSNWTPIWMGDCQLNKIMTVEVNGVAQTIPDDVVLPGGGEEGGEPNADLWFNWQDVVFGDIELVAGINVVSITFIPHDYTDTSQADFSGKFTANIDNMTVMTSDIAITPVTPELSVKAEDVSVEEEGGVPYYVVEGSFMFANHADATLEGALLSALAFDLQSITSTGSRYFQSSDAWDFDYVKGDGAGTFTLRVDVSDLGDKTPDTYASHFGRDENGNILDLNQDQVGDSVTGGSVKIGHITYEVVYAAGSSAQEECWGCVGLKVTSDATLTLDSVTLGTDIGLEVRDGKVLYVIKGGSVEYTNDGYTDDEIEQVVEKALKNYYYFDIQENPNETPGTTNQAWAIVRNNTHEVNLGEDGKTFEIVMDITDVPAFTYTTHLKEQSANTGSSGWNDFKPDVETFTDSVEHNGMTYELIYDKTTYWGCVGLKVSQAA